MGAYFKVRFLQIGRILHDLGVVRIVFLIGLLVFLHLFCNEVFASIKLLPLLIIGTIVSLLHFTRKDLLFIRTSLRNPISILLIEYFTLLFPLLIITLFATNLIIFLACILYIFTVAHVNVVRGNSGRQHKNLSHSYSIYVPQYLFEWLSGLRKNPLVLLIYIVGFALSFLPYASSICLWVIIVAIGSFYGENELLLLILKDEVNAYKFISRKVYYHTICYITFIAPIVAASLIFNTEQYILILYTFVSSSIALIVVILTKYATYSPSRRSVEFQIVSGIIILSIALFPLMVFTLIVLAANYSRAINNLNTYLYAYD